ncbi:YgiT-type zinc finger protein [Desulfolutivibrio sulfoxidireducens]|uniref:YgiT-type zinc finger protein n=1 Tax=Desulfolutivibrio sulfoxidireducens TaxID=2773299 RepID=UPI001C404355
MAYLSGDNHLSTDNERHLIFNAFATTHRIFPIKTTTANCPHDGAHGARHEAHHDHLQGLVEDHGVPGWYCPVCGEGIHRGADMKVTDMALNQPKFATKVFCANGNLADRGNRD